MNTKIDINEQESDTRMDTNGIMGQTNFVPG